MPVRPLPPTAGIGLRAPHVPAFLDEPPAGVWVEVHSENYLAAGGPRPRALETIRRDRPVSCHGVGLSPGSADGLDAGHLAALAGLYRRVEPAAISEHVAWCAGGGAFLNDLLPLPYTEEALDALCRNVLRAQDAFGRPLLMENPSRYLDFAHSTIPEPEFLGELARRTGCGLLLDVNNLHLGAANLGFDPLDWLAAAPLAAVGEIHVAGHAHRAFPGGTLLIDDHGSAVADPVWRLLELVLARTGPLPVLIERDNAIPPLPDLLAEAAHADRLLAEASKRVGEVRHAAA